MEIKPGEGGQDSKLFASDLLKAYIYYSRNNNLDVNIVDDFAITISGKECYKHFRKESGTHCVQRVPPTERNGRRQTSFISVAVLPITENQKFELNLNEVEITTQTGHGKGGQNVNKVASAVRAVHKPSGLMVFINGRDQHHNKKLALQILSARLEEQRKQNSDKQKSDFKSQQFGSFGRGGTKIRTYNFIDSRVVDHRTNNKTTRIDDIMKGRFELIL